MITAMELMLQELQQPKPIMVLALPALHGMQE